MMHFVYHSRRKSRAPQLQLLNESTTCTLQILVYHYRQTTTTSIQNMKYYLHVSAIAYHSERAKVVVSLMFISTRRALRIPYSQILYNKCKPVNHDVGRMECRRPISILCVTTAQTTDDLYTWLMIANAEDSYVKVAATSKISDWALTTNQDL